MATLLLVAAVAAIDIVRKAMGLSTITQEARANKVETGIFIGWFIYHVYKKERP